MKIYTKTGDTGKTSLLEGTRVSKTDIRIEAYGNVDELNSYIGMLRDQEINKKRVEFLMEIQNTLFIIGSTLAQRTQKYTIPEIKQEYITSLEKEIDTLETFLPPLKNFIIPGGNMAISFTHIARTVCRRTERYVVRLQEVETINPLILQYLNRLSDYLFVLSRTICKELSLTETLWNTPKNNTP
ncbi:MAG: cob(I)yrinic acid a,c-diamide adenosyltransferase [Chitinophagaceae bacterium]|nr:cob(I)yrinic acid a,c-diamide adenosyltransferase [Chitinophagaceae bacterium]